MTKHTAEPREERHFLYPVITIDAPDEGEAIDRVFEAIFEAGIGEIPCWLPKPPSAAEKRLNRAAPDLLAACERLALWDASREEDSARLISEACSMARAAIAKATTAE